MHAVILRVGLTGNIAAGKSTVAGWLEDLGCHILDLDVIAHDCLLPGEPTQREVVAEFGNAIVRADATIDRGALGALVFNDPTALLRLESILHPAIREREVHRVEEIAASTGAGIVVTEAALLYETGACERYDRMVVVVAPDDLRRQRLQARGLGADEALRRMSSQMDQYRKAELADYVVDNGDTMEAAHAHTCTLAGLLRRDLVRRMANEPLATR